MKILKFFKKKKNKKVSNPEEVKQEIYEELPENSVICEYCNKPIFTYEKRKTIAKKKYHLKCWRKQKNQIKSQIFN